MEENREDKLEKNQESLPTLMSPTEIKTIAKADEIKDREAELDRELGGDLKADYGLEKKSVEEITKIQTKTSIMREGVLYLRKIWESLELLAFIWAAFFLIWAGGKLATMRFTELAGLKDFAEVLILSLTALLCARFGWEFPNSKVKQSVERTILGRK